MNSESSERLSIGRFRPTSVRSLILALPILLSTLAAGRALAATAADVEELLLPLYMGGFSDEVLLPVTLPDSNLGESDAWWALRSQLNMAIAEPETNVMHLGSHNAFNALREGFKISSVLSWPVAPNQLLSLQGQLDIGARLMELDLHDDDVDGVDGRLILKHGTPLISTSRNSAFLLSEALNLIYQWLIRPENSNEVIYLDIEDVTEDNESDAGVEQLIPLFDIFESDGESLIFTPEDRKARCADEVPDELCRWPSRLELLQQNKRVIIFTHRNDSDVSRFGTASSYIDKSGHQWWYSSIAFQRDGAEQPDQGVYIGDGLDDVDEIGDGDPRLPDLNYFYGVKSDGLRALGPAPGIGFWGGGDDAGEPKDFQLIATYNVNFMQPDFLFTHDEDADLGNSVLDDNDARYSIWDQGERQARLEALIWSWEKGDPAVDRQIFQDLIPGDGSGAAQREQFTASTGLLSVPEAITGMDLSGMLDERGSAARSNGRDYALLRPFVSRWQSFSPIIPAAFALRSVSRGCDGQYDWKISDYRGFPDAPEGIPPSELIPTYPEGVPECDQLEYMFAAPANGWQNLFLLEARVNQSRLQEFVWINANDTDRDGNWTVNNDYPVAVIAQSVDGVEFESEIILDAENSRIIDGAGTELLSFGASSDPDGDRLHAQVFLSEIENGEILARSELVDMEAVLVRNARDLQLEILLADGRGAVTRAFAEISVVSELQFFPGAAASFEDTAIGESSSTLEVSIKNVGDRAVTLLSLPLSPSPPFSLLDTNCPTSFPSEAPPGFSCESDFVFTPTEPGYFEQVLELVSDSESSPQRLLLAGRTSGGTPMLESSQAELSYGARELGSLTQEFVTISNIGDAELLISNISTSGPDFNVNLFGTTSAGTPCGALPLSLNPGVSCTLGVVFSPTDVGFRQEELRVESNSPSGALDIPITAEGLAFGDQIARLGFELEQN